MQLSLQVVVSGVTQNMYGTSASAPVFAAMGERHSGVGPFRNNTGLHTVGVYYAVGSSAMLSLFRMIFLILTFTDSPPPLCLFSCSYAREHATICTQHHQSDRLLESLLVWSRVRIFQRHNHRQHQLLRLFRWLN